MTHSSVRNILGLMAVFCILGGWPSIVSAQDQLPEPSSEEQEIVNEESADGAESSAGERQTGDEIFLDLLEALKEKEFLDVPPNPVTKSILFTGQEHSALREARTYTGVSSEPLPEDIFESFDTEEEEEEIALPPPEQRYITLSGILYYSDKSWVIWLNGQRVTPDSVPEEVLDLNVYKEYVELRWYDKYTKRVIPIRLRANQRFQMDARIFLPG